MILEKDINLIKRDAKLIKELASLYYLTFNKEMKVGCGSCYHKSYIELKDKLNHTTMEQKCKFKLSVSNIRAFGSGNLYTNDTLTDEVAIAYLKENKARLSQFSKVPDNLDELLEGKKKKAVKKTAKKETVKTDK